MGCGRLTLRGSVQDGPTRNEYVVCHILMHVVHPYAGMHSSSHAFMYTCRQAEPQKWKSYIYVYRCIHIYVHVHSIDMYIHICMYVCMYVCKYVCMDAWTYGCMDVWMYGCMDV